jgi:hypothetical protein
MMVVRNKVLMKLPISRLTVVDLTGLPVYFIWSGGAITIATTTVCIQTSVLKV